MSAAGDSQNRHCFLVLPTLKFFAVKCDFMATPRLLPSMRNMLQCCTVALVITHTSAISGLLQNKGFAIANYVHIEYCT